MELKIGVLTTPNIIPVTLDDNKIFTLDGSSFKIIRHHPPERYPSSIMPKTWLGTPLQRVEVESEFELSRND